MDTDPGPKLYSSVQNLADVQPYVGNSESIKEVRATLKIECEDIQYFGERKATGEEILEKVL